MNNTEHFEIPNDEILKLFYKSAKIGIMHTINTSYDIEATKKYSHLLI